MQIYDRTESARSDRAGQRTKKRSSETDQQRQGNASILALTATADSLHVGHFMALCLMKRLQMAGNQPIALIGGGTGYDRRPVRPHRYAQDDDAGDHPAQLRLLQEADGALHRLRRGQGHHGQQRRLAAEPQLYRAAARGRRLLLASTTCSAPSATSSAWKRA